MTFDTGADFDQFLNGIQNAGFDYPGEQPPEGDEPPPPDEDVDVDNPDPGPGPATPPPPATFRVGDRDVPAEEVRALYEVGRMFREGSLTPPAPAGPQAGSEGTPHSSEPPPPTPVAIPDFIDQTDPTQMGVWKTLQGFRDDYNRDIAALRQNQEQITQQTRVNQLIEHSRTALAQFRSEHPSITDEEVNTILPMAQPIADAMVARYGDDVTGLKKAFYISALEFDGTRNKVLGTGAPSAKQQSEDRKRKLGSLSGNSGPSPRGEQQRPQLTTDRQAKEEFAKALTDSFGANGRLS